LRVSPDDARGEGQGSGLTVTADDAGLLDAVLFAPRCFRSKESTVDAEREVRSGFHAIAPNVELVVTEQREFELPADSADIGLRKE